MAASLVFPPVPVLVPPGDKALVGVLASRSWRQGPLCVATRLETSWNHAAVFYKGDPPDNQMSDGVHLNLRSKEIKAVPTRITT